MVGLQGEQSIVGLALGAKMAVFRNMVTAVFAKDVLQFAKSIEPFESSPARSQSSENPT